MGWLLRGIGTAIVHPRTLAGPGAAYPGGECLVHIQRPIINKSGHGLHLQTALIQVNRRVTDRSGVVWSVIEAYEVTNNSPHDLRRPEARVAMLWFETESGRTASALIPGRSLDQMDDEDILEFLQVAIERRGRQP